MNKEDIQTFSITFKTTNEASSYITRWMEAHGVDIISDRVLPNTDEMYKNDPVFKKMLKEEKIRKRAKEDYIIKNNHKY